MACYTIYKGIRYNSTEDLKKALLKEHSLDNIFQKRFKSLPIDLKLQKIGVVKTISSDNSNKGQSVKPKNYVSSLDTKTTDTVFKPKEYKEEYKDVDLPVSINKELKKVLDELSSISKNINIVGEAVVDLLQGKTPKNLNFEVYGTDLAKLKKVLSKFGEVKDYGSSYGMLVLKISDLKYEFSIPRQDIKTGKGITGYEIKVNPNLSINEASQRRGFTLNGMSYNPITKTLYDPHNGLKDLHEGVLKHINDQAFYDNPTLVLELMQLQSITGHKIDDTTLDLIKLMITDGRMSELNKSKVYSEWKNWAINGKYHSLLFDFLRNSGLDQVYPEFRDLAYTPQDEVYHPEGNVEEHTMQVLAKASEIADRENLDDTQREILIFAALLHDIAKPETTKAEWSEKQGRTKITSKGHEAGGVKPTEKFLNKIGLKDTNTIETIKALVREHLAHASISSITEEGGKKSAFAKLVKRLNPATVEQLLLLMEADMMGRNNANSEIPLTIQEFKRLLDNYKLENSGKLGFTPILKGSHLISFGITQGPLFGAILKKAKEAQLNIEFETEAEAVEWLGTYLADNNYLPKDFTDNKTRIEDQIETYDKKITKTEVEKNPDKVYLTEDGSLKDHSNVIVMNLENGENVTNNQTNNTQQKTKLFNPNDKTLKKGSVVEYYGQKYLFWNLNDSGKAQLIKTDGTKFPGTPKIDKLIVLGSYKTTKYNGTEYIVTDNNNVYSGATGNLVYTSQDNSSIVQKNRIIEQAKNENLNNQTNNTQQEKTLTNNQRKHDPDYDSLINNNTKGYSRVKIAIGKDKFAYVMGKTVILEGFEDYEFFVHKNEGGIYEIIEKSTGRSLPTSPVGDYESITAVTKATLNALKDIGKQKFVETVNKTDKIESNINEISSNNIQQSTTTNNLDNNNKLFQEVESILRSGKTIVVPAVLQSTHPNLAQHITQVVSTIQNEENNKIEAPCKGGASI